MVGWRDLAVLGTTAASAAPDRPRRIRLGAVTGRRTRAFRRGELHDRDPRRVRGAPRLAGGEADWAMLPLVPRLLQDLEHGDRRRQFMHGAAGGSDDFAVRGARRRLH